MSYSPIDLVESYLRRFVAYPSEHALVAHTLWIAHTHLMELWDTTPRLAFMSPERETGKSVALEITELFVPDPILSFNMSPAVLMRLVAKGGRTLLYDEIDQIFGSAKRQEANGELCGYMNAGYRRGAKAYRCVGGNGKKIEVEEFDAFAPVALAGLRSLPDTLASRTIIVRMHRAIDGEIEKFRHKFHHDEAKPIKDELVEWCEEHAGKIDCSPRLPAGIDGRAADIWEPPIAIAEMAGSDWPSRARAAAVHFTKSNVEDEALTKGVELLTHCREAFGNDDKLWGETLLQRLIDRDESPWKDLNGSRGSKERPLDQRGLAQRLKPYGIKSKDVWIEGKTKKGYSTADFADAWKRYLSAPCHPMRDEREEIDNKSKNLADLADLALSSREGTHRNEDDPDDIGNIPWFMDRRRKPWQAQVGDGDQFECLKDRSYALQPNRGAVALPEPNSPGDGRNNDEPC
jgi:hypothetical protein